jgi:two-component system, OmpR family, phosphate regulon sensor histidine kinase PhoR
MASQELTRLDLLVNKVMNSILMDHGNQALQLEPVDFKLLIERTLKLMEIHLHQRNAKVNFKSDANEMIVPADALLVQGILYNLIDNSLKYGKDGPEISIHLSETPSHVVIEFSDNGQGIPEEYIDKVFEKFLRVPTGNKHNVKGYGLGLNYVAQVMKQHHGSVLVKNLPQGGCVFTLKFPKQ